MVKRKKQHPVKSEVWRMRCTASDKYLLNSVVLPESGGSATFWRDVNLEMAEKLLKLKSGDITVSEFSSSMGEFAERYLEVTSGESKDEDKHT